MPESPFDTSATASDVTTLFISLLAGLLLLAPLERWLPAHRTPQAHGAKLLNLAYWFFTPLVTKAITNWVLLGCLGLILSVLGRPLDESALNGFGPLSYQPLWLQTAEILVAADFMDYWTHRFFHTSSAWRFHAVHHGSETMTWLAAARVHPVNDVVTRVCQVAPIALLGFSPRGILLVVPLLVAYVILLHTNVKWNFGPLRHVFVSPAYHRWHHTADDEGVDKNFAGMFPVWDRLFGTQYCPTYEPKKFGVRGTALPKSLWGQLAHPFRRTAGVDAGA